MGSIPTPGTKRINEIPPGITSRTLRLRLSTWDNAERRREEAMSNQPAILRCSFCNKDHNEIVAGKFDNPSASDDYIAIASPWHGPKMTKCPTCGHLWPFEEPAHHP